MKYKEMSRAEFGKLECDLCVQLTGPERQTLEQWIQKLRAEAYGLGHRHGYKLALEHADGIRDRVYSNPFIESEEE